MSNTTTLLDSFNLGVRPLRKPPRWMPHRKRYNGFVLSKAASVKHIGRCVKQTQKLPLSSDRAEHIDAPRSDVHVPSSHPFRDRPWLVLA